MKIGPLRVSWGHKTSRPENHAEDIDPRRPQARDVLEGCELAMVAYKIDNGYLLRIGNSLMVAPPLIYCADEQDMATKIVAYRAKQKIMANPDPRHGVKVSAVNTYISDNFI